MPIGFVTVGETRRPLGGSDQKKSGSPLSRLDALVSGLRRSFERAFETRSQPRIAVAPGRVNLIGEHTDYNDGWALPMAIDFHVAVAFRPSVRRRIRAYSSAFDEEVEVELEGLRPGAPVPSGWGSYVAGVAWALADAGTPVSGMDCVIDGDLPVGAGLSSSAALELAVARALCEVSEMEWNAMEMAAAAQRAENRFVGVACGAMDQIAVAAGQEDEALLLDFRALSVEPVTVPRRVAVVILDTGARRSLLSSAYNARRQSCERAVRRIASAAGSAEIGSLRDVTPELLTRVGFDLDEVDRNRVRHVVEENARPRALAEALQIGDFERAGALMNDSHRSLRDLYEVSGPELDHMVDSAQGFDACWGARLTGAGFGGCAVALVESEAVPSFIQDVQAAYARKFDLSSRLFPCRPTAGARLIS